MPSADRLTVQLADTCCRRLAEVGVELDTRTVELGTRSALADGFTRCLDHCCLTGPHLTRPAACRVLVICTITMKSLGENRDRTPSPIRALGKQPTTLLSAGDRTRVARARRPQPRLLG